MPILSGNTRVVNSALFEPYADINDYKMNISNWQEQKDNCEKLHLTQLSNIGYGHKE